MDNESQNSDAVTAAAEARIIRKRDELLAERALLVQQREELLARLRRSDRALADCRAAARFFDLKIDFPEDESEQIERVAERERLRFTLVDRLREAAGTRHELSLRNQPIAGKMAVTEGADTFSSVARQEVKPEPITTTIASDRRRRSSPPRHTLRDVILDRLTTAGLEGSKAAPIREFYERTFGKVIHEKTVGMTLYRLQNDGLVRHEGHTWFLVPPKVETGNPGGDTPGPL